MVDNVTTEQPHAPRNTLNRAWLFTRKGDATGEGDCDHDTCKAMRYNFQRIPEYADDPRVKALEESATFADLSGVILMLSPILGRTPEDAAVSILIGGMAALEGSLDKMADDGESDDNKRYAENALRVPEVASVVSDSSWLHDAALFVQICLIERQSPATIGIGLMVLYFAHVDGTYKSYTPADWTPPTGLTFRTDGPGEDAAPTADADVLDELFGSFVAILGTEDDALLDEGGE